MWFSMAKLAAGRKGCLTALGACDPTARHRARRPGGDQGFLRRLLLQRIRRAADGPFIGDFRSNKGAVEDVDGALDGDLAAPLTESVMAAARLRRDCIGRERVSMLRRTLKYHRLLV